MHTNSFRPVKPPIIQLLPACVSLALIFLDSLVFSGLWLRVTGVWHVPNGLLSLGLSFPLCRKRPLDQLICWVFVPSQTRRFGFSPVVSLQICNLTGKLASTVILCVYCYLSLLELQKWTSLAALIKILNSWQLRKLQVLTWLWIFLIWSTPPYVQCACSFRLVSCETTSLLFDCVSSFWRVCCSGLGLRETSFMCQPPSWWRQLPFFLAGHHHLFLRFFSTQLLY